MRTFSIIIYGMLFSLALSSCQKFVDIKKSSQQAVLSTAADCQLMLDDYAIMNTGYPIDGEISSDDYYITDASYQLATIPQEEKNLYTWNATAQRVSAVPNWQNPYRVIYNANLVLQTLDKLKGSSDNPVLLNTLRGSALFFRAYCFWSVAQLYTKPYSTGTAAQDPGIPLRLDPDINGKSSRGTVQDTYSRILQDLKEAVNLLPNTSSIASRPNKQAAYAMLARTYLSMGDYPNALSSSSAALAINKELIDYNDIDPTSGTPFTRFNNSEVIFHAITYYKTSAPIGGPVLAPGRASNNTAKINPALVSSYENDDLRRQIFMKENTTGGVNNGTFRFTGNYENASSSALFFTGLATDELYLIEAECYARALKVPEAVKDLNDLLKKRWVTGTYSDINSNISADQALNKILEERRKELLMRGLRWTDLRRLKKSISRTVTSNGATMTYTLPAGDLRYTLLIPKEVMDNSSMAQNQR